MAETTDVPEARSEQVNVRLTKTEYDTVQALIFLDDGRSSATDVLRSTIAEFLRSQRKDPEVELALKALETRRARRTGKLKSLRAPLNDSA